MKVRYSLTFDRKKQLEKKGLGLVQIQAYLDGGRKYFTTKLYLSKKDWDFKRNVPKDPYLSKSLREKIATFEEYEVSFRALNKYFDLRDFEGFLRVKPKVKVWTFTEFYKEQLLKETHLAFSTLTSQRKTFNTLREFQSIVSFDDLNYEFLQNFENYLRNTKNHKINTIEKYHRHLRKYINLAIMKEVFMADKNPYNKYKLVTEETETLFLSPEEREKIEILEFSNVERELEKVRDMFLFSCYTGLRFSDAYSLVGADFQRTDLGLVLKFKAGKTHKYGYQPLYLLFDGRPQEIAKKYISVNPKVRLFQGYYNGKVNRLLKVIAKRARVMQGLYFKASRDTFGTTLYMLSGDQKLVQKQLQHRKREQTDKYVHIIDQIQNEGLKKAFKTGQKSSDD